jgi:hypothetical protein
VIVAHPSPGPGRAAARPGEGAGLVPSKTKGNFHVSLSAPECALRRIRRLKKSVWASGKLHGLADRGHRAPVCWFVTLTYRGVDDWRADHMKEAGARFRRWCKWVGVPCRYTWVAELQQRGAVHYHLLAWLPHGVRMPMWDRGQGRRTAFWPHGMTNTEPAKSGVGYLMKYLSKLGEFHRFPKGLRLYGIGGLNDDGKNIRRWYNLPEWAKAAFGVGDLVRCAGRLVVQATGEILAPAFAVSFVPGGLQLRQLRDIPEREHVGPYSTLGDRAAAGALT